MISIEKQRTICSTCGTNKQIAKVFSLSADIPKRFSEYQEIQVIHRQLQRVSLIKGMTGTRGYCGETGEKEGRNEAG